MHVQDLVTAFKKKYQEDAARFEDLPGLTSTWDPERLVGLFAMLRAADVDASEISAIIQVPSRSVSSKCKQMNWKKFETTLEKLCFMAEDTYDAEVSDKYRTRMLAKSALKQRRKKIDMRAWTQQIREELTVPAEPAPKRPPIRIRTRSPRTSTPEHMVLILSDLHVGLDFSMSDTGGLNEYNVDVFKRRLGSLEKGLLEIYGYHSKWVKLPELHVICLGDLIQGSNLGGNWGPAYTREDVIEQTRLVDQAVSGILSTWAGVFEKVHFYGIVGNHGRAGATKNSDKPNVNFETLIYESLRLRMREHKNVIVQSSDTWWGQKNINGVEFAWVHGDNIRGSLSSLMKKDLETLALLQDRTGKPFQVLCMGHHHVYMQIHRPYGTLIVNGSFVGGDGYSMQQLSTKSAPSQTLLGVNPKGITFTYPLELERPRD